MREKVLLLESALPTRSIPSASRYRVARDGRVFRMLADGYAVAIQHSGRRVIVTLDDGRRTSRRVAVLLRAVWGST